MNQPFRPGTGAAPTSTVEVSISCQNLLDKDISSRSDPMCVVYTQPWATGQWEEFLRTEVVYDNLNPEFAAKVKIDYRFEEEQPLRFVVYDIDNPSNKLEAHDFLGFAECTLGRIVSAGFNGLQLPLSLNINSKYTAAAGQVNAQGKHTNGAVTLIAEELVDLKDEITFRFSGSKMGGGFLGCCRSRTFYTISKINETGKYILVYKSQPCPGSEPDWGAVTLPISTVCNGDKDRKLKLEFLAEGYQGYHNSVGSVFATVNRLVQCGEGRESLPLMSESGQQTPKRLTVVQCKLAPLYTFVDYIRGGTQIHCCFAIDMTGSNGDPNDPGSLHFIGAAQLSPGGNPYEQAIQSVGDIIQDYDPSKAFPSYGFGARVPPSGTVSHKFHLDLQSPASPVCYGIPGVIDAYRSCIRQVQLHGPTNFSPIIREVATQALQNSGGPHYYVLLIITDGVISDMEETTKAIIEASSLPMSIIIVGVGGANFDAMDVLDGDAVRLTHNGRTATRDIVQFVPYRDAYSWVSHVAPGTAGKYAAAGYDHANTFRMAKVKLAQEVLAEIPAQLTSYMKSRGIVPTMLPPPY